MKRFTRTFGYILMALFFSVALSGCGKIKTPPDPKLTNILVWSFEDEDVWKPIAKNFASKNKNYSLTYQKQTFDSTYENRVLNAILSNQGPDVWNMPNDWVYRHKDKLFSVPINPSSKDVNVGIGQFNSSVVNSVVFDNQVYALSSYSEPLIVYYNPKIFEQTLSDFNKENSGSDNSEARKEASRLLREVPGTWTDFTLAVNMITKLNSDGGIELSGAGLGTDQISNSADILYLLMLQNETKVVADDLKQASFNLPAGTPKDTSDLPGLRALDFYTSFADPMSENYSWDASIGDNVEAFANGKTAMIFGYSSLQNYFAQKYPDFKFRRTSVPQLTSDSSKIIDYARFNAFGVSAFTNKYYGKGKTDKCWELIKLITSGSSYSSFNSAQKVYTSQKSKGEADFNNRSTSNPDSVELITAKSLVKGRYPTEFDKIIKNSISMVNQSTTDSQTALDTAARDITELLRKESW